MAISGAKGKARDGGGRRDRPVVEGGPAAGAARRVVEKVARAPHAVGQVHLAGAVAGGEAPDVRPVLVPAFRVGDGVGPLRVGGAARVLEVVDAALAHGRIPDAAEIDPQVRVLVAEERGEAQVLVAHEAAPGALVAVRPGGPGLGADRVGGRSEREQHHEHRLVVALPVVRDETRLRLPAHADEIAPHLRPFPVDAPVDRVDLGPDLRLVGMVGIEVGLGVQHAADQQRRVDRGQLAAARAVAGLHVEEVVEKSLVPGHADPLRPLRRIAEEPDGGERARARLLARDEAPVDADHVGRERHPDRGDARRRVARIAIGHHAVGRIAVGPEEVEGAALDVVEERRKRRARPARRRLDRGRRIRCRVGRAGVVHRAAQQDRLRERFAAAEHPEGGGVATQGQQTASSQVDHRNVERSVEQEVRASAPRASRGGSGHLGACVQQRS